jgi:hypothetical protein
MNDWDLSVAQEGQVTRLRIPRYVVLPLVVSDEAMLSRLYTDYLEGTRPLLESGVPLFDVLGAPDTVTVDIFFRDRSADERLDCSSWACEIMRRFEELDIFVRLAPVYFLTHLMRVRRLIPPLHEQRC